MNWGVRGATTVESNRADAIAQGVVELINELLRANQIKETDIVAVFFTMTPDLDALNPATAIRLTRDSWGGVPMLCSQEPVIQGMLPRCIRVLVQWRAQTTSKPVPIYLHGARSLRPDILEG